MTFMSWLLAVAQESSTFTMSGMRGFSGVEWSRNASFGGNSTGFSQAASDGNDTYAVINQFRFLAARSIRTSTIILATFNTISATATAAGIWYDSYSRAKRNRPRGTEKINVFTCVRGAETFPFILSLGIAIQGIIFAVSQSQGLDGLFESGCSLISQFMWPAVFIVPYLQVIFGLETMLRGFSTRPFPTRGKWTVAICLAVFVMALMVTGLVGFFIRAPNFCFASLFWFVARWAEGGFVLLLLISTCLIISLVTIFLRLTRNATIDTTERVIASRMVYYLALAAISTVLEIPFFGWLTFNDIRESGSTTAFTLAMIATVVANVSGLMTGGLHLFLRSNTISTIGPRDKLAEYERQQLKYKIRVQGPGGSVYGHALQPVYSQSLRRTESEESLVRYGKEEEADIENSAIQTTGQFASNATDPLRSNAPFAPSEIPREPEPAQLPASSSGHRRKPSYSLFPNKNNATSATSIALLPSTSMAFLPPTTYSPDPNNDNAFMFGLEDLRSPPSIKPNRHKRDSSVASSATVQIGLRLSNMNDIPRMPRPSEDSVHNFGYPNDKAIRPSPLATFNRADVPEPLSITSKYTNATDSQNSQEDMSKKTTPAVPHAIVSVGDSAHSEGETLSPVVYSPNAANKVKLPSPKGVGFNVLRRANTSPSQNTTSPPPSRNRNNSDAREGRGDWI